MARNTPTTEPQLSVVVATWRRPADLLRCLKAIDGQSRAASEIVVVVRPDDVATCEALAAAPPATPLRKVHVAAPGAVAALNAGLDAAGGRIVAITDDDAAPRPDWLERIHDHFEHRPDVGAVGGRDEIHPDSQLGSERSPTVGAVLPYGRIIGNHHRGNGAVREVDVLKGVNLALRREAMNGLRVDERLRGTGVEMHWELGLCLALQRTGWRVLYDPGVAVDHYPAARFTEDERADPALGALADEVHNETYALLRWLPWPAKVVALTYGLLVGTRRAPGALVALERSLRGADRAAVVAKLRSAQRARLAAVATAFSAATERAR